MWTGRTRTYGLLFVVMLGASLYWSALKPTHHGEWQALQRQLPVVELGQGERGDFYHISNLRDFRYHTDGAVAQAQYREGRYDVADLQRVWLGISHFGGYGLAHTFLSFEFAHDEFLAASVEARLRPGQSYSPFMGLVRQYNKIIVLGSEADIIGLRSHVRAERVLLYPLELDQAQRVYLLRSMMKDAQALAQQPDFYNTLLDNCTTNLLKYDPEYRFYTSLLNYRLLLPGFSDVVAQKKGWISTAQPLATLRLQATIDVDLGGPEGEGFSRAIRRGYQPASTESSPNPNK